MLKQGQRSDAVAVLQRALNVAMPHAQPPLVIDGIFGPKTHARVVAFQQASKLSPDGIAGPLTHAALFQGVDLTAKIVATRTDAPDPAPAERRSRVFINPIATSVDLMPGRLTPPPPLPGYTPWSSDPRGQLWQMQYNLWLAWLAQPFPKGPAPPLPPLLPPLDPPRGWLAPRPPWFHHQPPWLNGGHVPPTPQYKFPITLEGGTFELSGGWKSTIKDGQLVWKPQEFEAKFTFVRIPIIDSKTFEFGVDGVNSSKDGIGIEASATWKPFKFTPLKGDAYDLTLMPLISTALGTAGGEVFGGGKAALSLRPQNWGTQIDIGVKLGPKATVNIEDGGRLGGAFYPLTAIGVIEFRLR